MSLRVNAIGLSTTDPLTARRCYWVGRSKVITTHPSCRVPSNPDHTSTHKVSHRPTMQAIHAPLIPQTGITHALFLRQFTASAKFDKEVVGNVVVAGGERVRVYDLLLPSTRQGEENRDGLRMRKVWDQRGAGEVTGLKGVRLVGGDGDKVVVAWGAKVSLWPSNLCPLDKEGRRSGSRERARSIRSAELRRDSREAANRRPFPSDVGRLSKRATRSGSY